MARLAASGGTLLLAAPLLSLSPGRRPSVPATLSLLPARGPLLPGWLAPGPAADGPGGLLVVRPGSLGAGSRLAPVAPLAPLAAPAALGSPVAERLRHPLAGWPGPLLFGRLPARLPGPAALPAALATGL